MSTMNDPQPSSPLRPRSWPRLALAAGAILAAGAAIAFWPGRVNRGHLLAAAGAALAVAMLAARRAPPRRRAALLAALVLLAVLAPAAGAAGWYARDRARRAGLGWDALGPRAGGVTGLREALDRGDRKGAADLLLEHFRRRAPAGAETLPLPRPAEAARASDQLLDGVVEIFDRKPVRIGKDIDWDMDPLRDRTWRWFLHAMDYLLALVARHRETGDLRFLERAEEIVFDWVNDNHLYWTRPAGIAWHDHGTALRVRAWLAFWEPWVRSPLASAPEVEDLLSAIAAHAGKLADPEFYTEDHNHGLEQDLALMAVSRAFPEFERSAAWTRVACERLARTAANTISPAGVHLEHSAYYHIFTLGILTGAYDFARRHGLPCGSEDLARTLDKMARYAAYLIQPDGRVPLLGDTEFADPYGLDDPVLSRYAERDPILRYNLSRGREGTPGEAAVVYPEEGYAIIRDAWRGPADFDQGLYLLFAAAAHPGRAHKQADDLSFILFARGRELITDAGLYGYDDRMPFRRHVLSAAAHNVVLIDGAPFRGFATRMGRQRLEPDWTLVEGIHENHPGMSHRRTLAYLRPWTLFIIDELKPLDGTASGAKEHRFEQIFHLAADLDVLVAADRSGVSARPGGGAGSAPAGGGEALIRLRQLAAGRGTAVILKGAMEPLRGWVSRAHHEVIPAPAATFTAAGREATFVTWIEVAPAAADGEARLAADPAAGQVRLEWPAAGGVRRAVIHRGADFRIELGEGKGP